MSILSHAMMILLMMFITFSLDFKSKRQYIEATVEWFGYIAIVVMLGIGYANDYITLPIVLLFGLCFWELRKTRARTDNMQSEIVLSLSNEMREILREKRQKK